MTFDSHLFRTQYCTDVSDDEPEYKGMVSTTIPASALEQGKIVHIDWSERGWVEVTFLIPGRSVIPEVPFRSETSV
jgi:hypothetical protein